MNILWIIPANNDNTDMKKLFWGFVAIIVLAACEAGDYGYSEVAPASDRGDSYSYKEGSSGEVLGEPGFEGEPGEGPGEEPGPQHGAGIITAGEWCDLDNWGFWGNLMTYEGEDTTDQEGNEIHIDGYSEVSGYWKFWTDRRVAVQVVDASGKPQPGVRVTLYSGTKKVWDAVTDVAGRADCWIGLHDKDFQASALSISLDGKTMDGAPEVTGWSDATAKVNEYVYTPHKAPVNSADILFIVDATGSMMDEIDFLKDDLLDILNRGSKLQGSFTIRTGAIFYRDEGDKYLTRESAFTKDYNKTVDFIKKQEAQGGGDYPEAVHTALEVSLQKFAWDDSARARLAFILLDAPPHHDHQGVIESIQKSIDTYAAMGIKLIPVASSGVDKPTEFLLRMMAITTGSTYVFLTDDSGVGNSHIKPTVGEYEVEQLNDLMVRLIQKYLQ